VCCDAEGVGLMSGYGRPDSPQPEALRETEMSTGQSGNPRDRRRRRTGRLCAPARGGPGRETSSAFACLTSRLARRSAATHSLVSIEYPNEMMLLIGSGGARRCLPLASKRAAISFTPSLNIPENWAK